MWYRSPFANMEVEEPRESETLRDYISRVGVSMFLRIVPLEDLRAMRLRTAIMGYTDRLDTMPKKFVIWLYKYCTSKEFQPRIPQNFDWKNDYSLEIREYYLTGNQSDHTEEDGKIFQTINLPRYPDPWLHLIYTEVLYPTIPRLECLRILLEKKTLFIGKTPVINIQYLETMLIFSPLYIADICERFLRTHYASSIDVELEDMKFLNEISGMSVRRLAVIYMLSYAVPGEAHKRRPPGIKQLCCWCFHEGSHYTNYCVIEYTLEMRLQSASRNRTCLVCGFWNRNSACPILNFHRPEVENFDCPSCHGFHSAQVCLNPSKFDADIKAAIRNIRLIAKATHGIDENTMIGLYRKIVGHFQNHKEALNAERYKWMQIDRFDRFFHKVRKTPINAPPRIRPRHSPPPPRVRKL